MELLIYIKACRPDQIDLPRQARDKQKETLTKEMRFSAAGWILSREGVVMEDVNIQVTRQQVDELMEKHGIGAELYI